MPLFVFMCKECEKIVEKFFHNVDNIEDVICDECGGECEKQFAPCGSRVWLDSRAMYNEKIKPDAERICNKIDQGSANDFFDIYGDK